MNATVLFKSFSEPVRLRLLHLLSNAETELCVCDLVSVLEIPQTTISRHLSHLRNMGLVTDRRDGQWIYYSMAPHRNKAHASLADCLKTCFADDAELSNDIARYHRLKTEDSLSCCPQRLSEKKSVLKSRKGKR